ncbi:MAG: AzlD domain-containing protein [Caldilineaceae bacterium]|nr:AzlD domain-containing protein [Caldilineaceae bacterium]
MMFWLTLVLIGLITFAYRFSFIALLERIKLPGLMQRALRFVPLAALTAITLPEVAIRQNALNLSLGNDRLVASLVAAVVAWRTKNVFLTILIGMICLYILQSF